MEETKFTLGKFSFPVFFLQSTVQWPAKKVSHHLNVNVIKALITHLDFYEDFYVTEK
jgi:hypothetical protein